MIVLRIGAFLVANLASFLAARRLAEPIRTGDPAVDFLHILLLRLLLVTGVTLGAGLTGTLEALPLGILGAAVCAILLASGDLRKLGRPRLPESDPWVRALGAAVLFRLALQVWFFAPHLGDAVAYHLPKVAEWVRAGRFGGEMGLHPHATFPAGFELVETWWVVFLRHDALIEAAGVEFVLLAGAAVRVLARWAGLGERGASATALVYILTPGFHLSATSCLNDAPAAAMVLAVGALLAGGAPWGMALLATGLGVGIKATAGFPLPGIALLALGRPAGGRRAWVYGGAGVATGAFWYVRNGLWFGNPFHPLGTAGLKNPVAVQLGPSAESLWHNLSDLFDLRMLDPAAACGANVDHGAGWGAVAVSLGLVGLVRGAIEEARHRRLAAAFGAGLLGTLLFVQNDPWCLKYALFFPAALAVGAVRLAERGGRGARLLLGAGIVFSLAGTFLPYDLPWKDFKFLAAQSVSDRSALLLWAPDVPDDRVGAAGDYRVRSYLLYRPDFSRRVVYLREGDGLGRLAPEEGVRFVYAEGPPALEEGLRAAGLRPVGLRLYRRPESSDRPRK